MDDKKMIPYIAFESICVRHERTTKRLAALLVIAIILLFASNLAWLYTWTQYDYVDTEYTQDGEGYNNINTGTQGDINNGAEVKDSKANKER